MFYHSLWGFPNDSAGKDSACSVGDTGDVGSIPGSGRSPERGHGNPLSILAWRIPQTEESHRLQFKGSQRVRQLAVSTIFFVFPWFVNFSLASDFIYLSSLSLFFPMSLAKSLSILFIFSNNLSLFCCSFCCFLVLILFISVLILIISFLLLTLYWS